VPLERHAQVHVAVRPDHRSERHARHCPSLRGPPEGCSSMPPPAPPLCPPQVELLHLGSPFARKPDVVAYDRHVLFASDDPADAARHSSP
jgi:hypothetical protein